MRSQNPQKKFLRSFHLVKKKFFYRGVDYQSVPFYHILIITDFENQIHRTLWTIYALSYSHSFNFYAAFFKWLPFFWTKSHIPKSFKIAKLRYLIMQNLSSIYALAFKSNSIFAQGCKWLPS